MNKDKIGPQYHFCSHKKTFKKPNNALPHHLESLSNKYYISTTTKRITFSPAQLRTLGKHNFYSEFPQANTDTSCA